MSVLRLNPTVSADLERAFRAERKARERDRTLTATERSNSAIARDCLEIGLRVLAERRSDGG